MLERDLDAAEKAAIRQAVLAWRAAYDIDPVVVYLHGSRGTVWQRAGSDWDFAILCASALTWERRMALMEKLTQALKGETIDLADLRQSDTVFAAHVVCEGEAVYVSDDAARQQYEMLALANYARLNEERQGILQDIRQRGTIYRATEQV